MITRPTLHAIVFDFDGTLATCPYDFVRMREAVLSVARAYGIAPEQLGPDTGLLESIEYGTCLLQADDDRATDFHREAMASLCALEYEAAAYTHLLPGTAQALADLHDAGYRLGVITRNSTAAVMRILGETKLPVEKILCRENVQHPKPHPEHVERMLSILQHAPAASLMVGDHPMDVETGKAAGMYTAAVLTGQTGEPALRAAEPDLLFPSVVELVETLLNRADTRW
ncbi:MAG TPA: HAD family hydrolase [Armatimonadota bacterium]|nr:HAD family hydrolase [Armatimonadota bacterium]